MNVEENESVIVKNEEDPKMELSHKPSKPSLSIKIQSPDGLYKQAMSYNGI